MIAKDTYSEAKASTSLLPTMSKVLRMKEPSPLSHIALESTTSETFLRSMGLQLVDLSNWLTDNVADAPLTSQKEEIGITP